MALVENFTSERFVFKIILYDDQSGFVQNLNALKCP